MSMESLSDRLVSRRTLVATTAAAAGLAMVGKGVNLAAAQDGAGIVVTMVTDTAGLGDQSFNDITEKGGQDAVAQFGVTFGVIESAAEADYSPNLAEAAEGSQLVIATGFLLTDAVVEIAPQFPDASIMLIDAVAEADNVSSVLFKENEGGFLGGVVAGLFTTSNVVGILGGIRIPPVYRYENGFVAGVRSVNPDAQVIISYADSFGDPVLGKELSLAQYNQGADIVFPIAGATGTGSFDAAVEKGAGFWVIAADADQAHLGPDNQLATVAKKIDVAVLNAVASVVDGSFAGGVLNLGIVEDGVDLISPAAVISQDILDTVALYKAALADGTIVAPGEDADLVAFVPVAPADLGSASPVASPMASPAS
ncbi:MAG: BMP family ABC transporter substrate-binding protein [Thermomicrobiales bacterium]